VAVQIVTLTPTQKAVLAAFEPMTPEQREALTAYLHEGPLDHEAKCVELFGPDVAKRIGLILLNAIL
jgi:hypothetical protein